MEEHIENMRTRRHFSYLVKSAKVHGAPVDATAQLADVDHVAVARSRPRPRPRPGHSHAHLLHEARADPAADQRAPGHRVARGRHRAQLTRVLELKLKTITLAKGFRKLLSNVDYVIAPPSI